MSTSLWLMLIALMVNGLLVGASLDQSIKQLPARHSIGAVAFSEYSKAADLRNGIAFYATLGVGGAVSAIAAAVAVLVSDHGIAATTASWLVIVLTLAHSVATGRAAPTNFRQRAAAGDPAQLTAIFDRFVRMHTIRVTLQCLTLLALAWAFAALIMNS